LVVFVVDITRLQFTVHERRIAPFFYRKFSNIAFHVVVSVGLVNAKYVALAVKSVVTGAGYSTNLSQSRAEHLTQGNDVNLNPSTQLNLHFC